MLDVLNKRVDDIEAPKALPPGTYLAIVDGPYVEVKSPDKGTPGLQFTFRLLQPINVADQEALALAGGCAGKTVRHTFYITENSEFFLKNFLKDHLGIDVEGKTVGQALAETQNRQVAVSLRQTLTKGNEPRLIHVVDGTAKV